MREAFCAIFGVISLCSCSIAVVGWGLSSPREATLVITATSQNENDFRPEVIVIKQSGSTIHWTATGIYYIDGKEGKFESRAHEGTIRVEGIDLAEVFDEVKALEKNVVSNIPRTGALPYSLVLATKDRTGVCPDLSSRQRDQLANKSSRLRMVFDNISRAGIYAKQNDMLDLLRYPGDEGTVKWNYSKDLPEHLKEAAAIQTAKDRERKMEFRKAMSFALRAVELKSETASGQSEKPKVEAFYEEGKGWRFYIWPERDVVDGEWTVFVDNQGNARFE